MGWAGAARSRLGLDSVLGGRVSGDQRELGNGLLRFGLLLGLAARPVPAPECCRVRVCLCVRGLSLCAGFAVFAVGSHLCWLV